MDSYKIKNPVVMYKYIENHRGDEIAGSTAGVVYEWAVHNIAYNVGKLAVSIGFDEWGTRTKAKGQTLDVGQTIFNDSHGVMSVFMWATYCIGSPFSAAYDLYVHITKQ